MNCPSRTDEDEPAAHQGWNQNPSELAAEITTRQDLNGIVNLRTGQDSVREAEDARGGSALDGHDDYQRVADANDALSFFPQLRPTDDHDSTEPRTELSSLGHGSSHGGSSNFFLRIWRILAKFCKFIGPGFMISVAYIDPGNYSTDVSAGAATKYKLLFIVLMSNFFAIVLQSLAVRLGTVTGLNLAQHCRAHLPPWLNIILYIFGECAIIATDIAEVSLQDCPLARSFLTQVVGYRFSHRAQLVDKSPSRLGLRYHHP